MFFMNKKIKEKGQVMAEYSIILAVVACVAIAGFTLVGSNANNKAKGVADTISDGTSTIPTATPELTGNYILASSYAVNGVVWTFSTNVRLFWDDQVIALSDGNFDYSSSTGGGYAWFSSTSDLYGGA